jgi:hypothetical protein
MVAAAAPLTVLLWMAVSPLLFDDAAWHRWVHDEMGTLEWMTILALLPAVVVFLITAKQLRGRSLPLALWFLLLGVGAFYFAGEEASWGQHALGFTPPAAIAENNLQGEFNFHNTSGWAHDILNEIPRFLASAYCLVLCGVLPWFASKPDETPTAAQTRLTANSGAFLIPTRALVVPGVLATCVAYVETPLDGSVYDQTGRYLFYFLLEANDELKECLIAVVLCFYAIDRYRELKWIGHTATAQPEPREALRNRPEPAASTA